MSEQEIRAALQRALECLQAWERWEADWIEAEETWDTREGLPQLPLALYDRLCDDPDNLQEQRNAAIAAIRAAFGQAVQP